MDYIGLDLGTSAIKGVLVSEDGKLIARGKRPVTFQYPAPGFVEIDPEAHWQSAWSLIRELASHSDSGVAALAMAAASGNTILLNPDGTPRSSIISWLDTRLEDWTPPESWQVHEVVGWPGSRTFPLMHLEWFRREKPEMLQGALVGMNNDYLAMRLCGRRMLDYSSATPFYLMDQRNFCWHKPFCEYYGIAEDALPELAPCGTVIGTLLPELSAPGLSPETRIVTGSFDHPAAARALAVNSPDEMLLSCGTSWVGLVPMDSRRVVPGELCDPFRCGQNGGGRWASLFSVAQIGLELEAWIVNHYGNAPERYDRFNDAALAGDPAAEGKMLEVIRRFKERLGDRRPKRLTMAGGPAEGAGWGTLIARELGLTVEVSSLQKDAGAVGAAMLAGAPAPQCEYRYFEG